MTNIAAIAKRIGQTADYTTREGFTIPVTVQDVGTAYGRVLVVVTPLMGSGTVKVYESSLTFRAPKGCAECGLPREAHTHDMHEGRGYVEP